MGWKLSPGAEAVQAVCVTKLKQRAWEVSSVTAAASEARQDRGAVGRLDASV